MLPESSKVYVPLSLLGLVAAVVYSFVGDDKTGVVLFVGLCLSAALAAMVLMPRRDAAPVAAPAPATSAVTVQGAIAPRAASPGGWPLLVAIGATFLAVAFVYGKGWGIAGVLVILAGGVGWLAQTAGDLRGYSIDIGPVSIPVLAAAVIGSLMYFISRILLAVTAHGATAIAISLSALLLLVAIAVALRVDRLGSGALLVVLALGAVAVIAGGVGALAAGQNHRTERAAAAAEPTVAIVAKHTQFDTKVLDLDAGASELLRFENRDHGTFHNVAIYRDKNFTTALFNGTPNNGGTADYTTPALDPGTYYFHCDFHPTMQGTVDVK